MTKRRLPYSILTLVTLFSLLLPIYIPPISGHPFSAAGHLNPASDIVPPAPVIDLFAETGELPGTINLTWTAPGDDGEVGTASTYIIRYNSAPISENNWETSIDITGEPIPNSAGSIESMTVSGLNPGFSYYFALKTQDEALNTSNISNSTRAIAQLSSDAIFLPLVPSSTESVPIVIPETTKVLPESTTQYLASISNDGATFTFTQTTPALTALEPGDIMVGDAAENAPYGFLRKVTSIASVDGQLVVETEEATLEDAIESGFLEVTARF